MSLASLAQPAGSPAVSHDTEPDVTTLTCLHCATKLADPDSGPFCCSGCSFVYALIHREDLGRYYDLRGKRGIPLFGLGDRPYDTKWLEPIEAKLAEADGIVRIDLDVQGLHCTGCVWLIDAVFQKQEGAVQAVINPALGKARLGVGPGFSLREFVQQIDRFGYRFGPPLKDERPKSNHLVVRMGITIAIAMNSMIFAISTYAGLTEGTLARLFFTLNFGLSIVSVAVGGTVFFRSAFHGLRRGLLHLDLPIALGIIAAFAGSVWSYFERGSASSYFDTINIFIALMLVGRFLQERVLEKNRRYLLASDGIDGLLTRRIDEASSNMQLVPSTQIEEGDTLVIAPGDLVPTASTLEASQASFSLDWINGESRPREFVTGDTIPAGAFLAGMQAVTVKATEAFSASPLVDLLRSPMARDSDGPRTGAFWQRLTKWYVTLVLLAGAGGFAFSYLRNQDVGHSLDVLTAVLVITCPCAFGIATPLAYEIVQNGLRRLGLFIRAPGFLDRATSVKRVVFDKTGTLTTGTLRLEAPEALQQLDADARQILYNLASRSHHPKSHAVLSELSTDSSLVFDSKMVVEEHPGRGLSLLHQGREWRFGAPSWVSPDEHAPGDIAFGVDSALIASLSTLEELRTDARGEITRLRDKGYDVWILSGDDEARVRSMAETSGIEVSQAIGGKSPREKAAFISDIDRGDTMMIGDGINDSLVVEAAYASGTPAIDRPFMAARSDFYFVTAGLAPIRIALESSHKLRAVVRRNLTIAIVYNIGAVSLAWMGFMSPLLAAILMPISSIVTLLATITSLSGRSAPWKS